jgi:hypothetical protein
LDRAGVRAGKQPDYRANDGTVLWEEFVAVHRRRVLEAGTRGELPAGEMAGASSQLDKAAEPITIDALVIE